MNFCGADVRFFFVDIEAINARMDELERRNRWLEEQLEWALQRIYGKKSEKFDPRQQALFPPTSEESGKEEQVDPAPHRDAKPKKAGHGRKKFPASLPRKTFRFTLTDEERVCPDCGEALKEIGEDVAERGHIEQPKIVVHRFECVKYACPSGHTVRTAQGPTPLIDRCKYEPSVYAHIATAKFSDHLPLHRQVGIFKRYGIDLPKSTMWDMLVRIDEIAAQPILAQMRKELLKERILLADETPVDVKTPNQKGSSKGYLWTWRRKRKILFQFTLSRNRDGPRKFLEQWRGTLLTDGYTVYDSIAKENGIIRAGCWAHCRRKFKEALNAKAFSAMTLFRRIQRLFWIESALSDRVNDRGLTTEQEIDLRRVARQKYSQRLVDEIFKEAKVLRSQRSTLPKSKLGKALTYLENQKHPLTVFLNDPELPLENNSSERALRHVIVGRKNWQMIASPRGGEVAARLYSLIYSCKAIGLDPEAYLTGILRTNDRTSSPPIATLTPWAWAENHTDHVVLVPHVDR